MKWRWHTWAGFQRDVQVAIYQTRSLEDFASGTDGNQLGMGGGVVIRFHQIMRGSDDFAVFYDHRADRYFATSGRQTCLFEGKLHKGIGRQHERLTFSGSDPGK